MPNTKEVENRNVMLNASADNQPRQVSIGLPSELSATIYEDGTPVSWTWWPMLPYYYWAASPVYSHVGMKSLSENAITNGTVNYIIDSFMVVVFGGVGNLYGTLTGGLIMGLANKFLEPLSGAMLSKILILVALIIFIQKRPRGLFPQRGRAVED